MSGPATDSRSLNDDLLDRLLDRLWGRTGLRLVLVMVVVGWIGPAVAVSLGVAFVCRYLAVPPTTTIQLLVWSSGISVVGMAAAAVLSVRAARPLTSFSPRSSDVQQQRAEMITDSVFDINLVMFWFLVLPGLVALLVSTLHPDLPMLAVIVIAGIELSLVASWAGMMLAPSYGRVIRKRVQSVAGRTPPVRTRWGVRSRMIFAVGPPVLIASDLGIFAFAQPNVPHTDLLAGLVVVQAIIVAFLGASAPLLARSVTRPLQELTDGAERLKQADFSTPVPEFASDEFGVLARTLNEAMEGLADRELLASEVRESRSRIVAAADESRKRIERNIHDGAQQRLVALALDLRMLEDQAPALSSEELAAAHRRIGADLKTALSELRELARGLHPSVLTTDGLSPAIEQLVSRSSVPVSVDVTETRFPEAIETACYFTVAEALANVAKYAEATEVAVCVEQLDGVVRLQVSDNGRGGADPQAGSGLTGLVDRIAVLDGDLTVDSPDGIGTTVTVELPFPREVPA